MELIIPVWQKILIEVGKEEKKVSKVAFNIMVSYAWCSSVCKELVKRGFLTQRIDGRSLITTVTLKGKRLSELLTELL